MKNFIISTAVIFLFFSGAGFAQEPEIPSSRQLGISFSKVSGAGLYYQFFLNEDYRLKLDGLVIYNYGGKDDVYFFGNGGFEFQKTIHSSRYTRLYGLAGCAYWNERSRSPEYNDPADSDKVTAIDKYNNKWLTAGVGLGIEFLIFEHVAINVDLLYNFEHHFNDKDESIGFGGGGGIGYAF